MKRLIALLLTALCVFALGGCGSSTEWTMIDIKGQESRLSAQDAAAVDRCLKSKDWQDDLRDCIMVRLTDGSGQAHRLLRRLRGLQRSGRRTAPGTQRQCQR